MTDQATPRPEHEISPAQAQAACEQAPEQFFILDCRLAEELETACIGKPLHIPLHELEDRLDEIEDALEDRALAKDAPFAVLCHHGVRSLKATLMLHQLGFPGARSICGGIEAWSTDVDPSVPRYTRTGSRCTIVPAD